MKAPTAREGARRGGRLLRSALALAILGALLFVAIRLMPADHSAQANAAKPAVAGVAPVSQIALAGLETGACVSYTPTHGQLQRTIFVDPGHGGLDPGVVGTGAGGRQVLEKDATLAVAARLTVLLRGAGYRVVMARTSDTTVTRLAATDSSLGSINASAEHRDLVARAACANASGADVLLSIHFDGFDDRSVGGTETFYDPARPFADASKRLAQDLQFALVSELGEADRGVWTDDQLAAPTLTASGTSYGHLIELGPRSAGWVDNPTTMPGALVEPLFVTNPAEAQLASDPAGQQRIAEALSAGLLKFLSA
jgi:N-acetylmuramoyl-L-alanine amidase